VIATNGQAIFCHWVGLRQREEFGCATPGAMELLVFVRVRSSHTASVETRHSRFAWNVMARLESSHSPPEAATPHTALISALPLARRRAQEYPLS
jgi:hypothetical protein